MSKRFPVFIAVSAILFSLCPLIAQPKGGAAGWNVQDLTGALELAAVEEDGAMLTATVRNKSVAVVTAVALSFKPDTHNYQDWMDAEPSGLPPGKTFDVTVGIDVAAARKLKVAAVIFEDGSGKGDAVQLDIMNSHRFGQILESARIKEILKNRHSSSDNANLDALSKKVGKMPLSAEDAFLSLAGVDVPGIQLNTIKESGEKARNAVLWGVSTTRERAMRQLENVRNLPLLSTDERTPSRKDALEAILEHYEKQNRKATSLLARMQGGR